MNYLMAPTTKSPEVIAALKQVLADTFVFAHRAQGYHWNVTGENFPQFHAMFATIYEDAAESIDPIAENILKVGSFAPYHMNELAAMSRIPAMPMPMGCEAMCADLYMCAEALLESLFTCFTVAEQANQQGIADFMAGRIDAMQKWCWQLKASAGLFVDLLADEKVSVTERFAEIKRMLD